MFRHLFLSLLVYAHGGIIDRAPVAPVQPSASPTSISRPAGIPLVRPVVEGLVTLFVPSATAIAPDTDVVTLQPGADFKYAQIVLSTADKYGVDWRLVAAVISAESNFNPRARSYRGARGLMQVVPRTAALYDVASSQLFDPEKNIEAGVRHLKMLQERYRGNLELAVAAYNSGEAAVNRHRGVPPFRVTRAFVKKVMGEYRSRRDIVPAAGKQPALGVKLEAYGSADSPHEVVR